MIPTMILFGLILGRWWRPTLILAALIWPALLVAGNVMTVEAGLLPAAGLGALNAGLGSSLIRRCSGWCVAYAPQPDRRFDGGSLTQCGSQARRTAK